MPCCYQYCTEKEHCLCTCSSVRLAEGGYSEPIVSFIKQSCFLDLSEVGDFTDSDHREWCPAGEEHVLMHDEKARLPSCKHHIPLRPVLDRTLCAVHLYRAWQLSVLVHCIYEVFWQVIATSTTVFGISLKSVEHKNASVYMSWVQCFNKATIIYDPLLTQAVTMQDTLFTRTCSVLLLLQLSWRCGLLISSWLTVLHLKVHLSGLVINAW